MLLLSPRCSRLEYPQKPEANSGRNTATLPSNSVDVKAMRQKAAVTRPREGMARRQGGSFNSILARRKSPLVSQSSEQQRARGEKTYEAKKNHTITHVSVLTFLVPGCPTAPGCLCLWGTLFCVGGRPPSLSFFAISSVRSSRPRPSRTPTTLSLNQVWSGEKRGGANADWCRH